MEALCYVRGVQELKEMLPFLNREEIPYLAVGKGSNLLVRDGGLKGVVVVLRDRLASIEDDPNSRAVVRAGGGVGIGELLTHCGENGLGGVEFLAGIPGTVGGALAMNAGAFGKEIGSMVQEIQMVTNQGQLVTAKSADLHFSYRGISIPQGAIIVNGSFQLVRESPETISKRVADFLKKRRLSQPLEYPSGGSVFKNPPNSYAGRLIERSGLKGKEIGGAMISPKHANFIVNMGGARAEDILALMDLARERVKEDVGIELEPEIKVVGI